MSDDINRWQKLREILREHFDIMQPFSIDYPPTSAFLRLESAILALMNDELAKKNEPSDRGKPYGS